MTIEETLRSMVDSGKVHHAIMLHEDDGGGAVSVALEFLRHLYHDDNKVTKLIHPDVHFIFPVTSGNLSVSYSREWRELVLANPYFTENDLNEALGIAFLAQLGGRGNPRISRWLRPNPCLRL